MGMYSTVFDSMEEDIRKAELLHEKLKKEFEECPRMDFIRWYRLKTAVDEARRDLIDREYEYLSLWD